MLFYEVNMEIKIEDFFLKEMSGKFDRFKGSMRIYLPEKKICILGINVIKTKDRWFFLLPGIKTFDHFTGKPVGFPFISFSDEKEKSVFFHNLKECAIEYIIERIKNNSLKLPVHNESKLDKGKNKPRFAKKVQNGLYKKRSVVAKTNNTIN